jgi:Zn-dependent protease
LLSVRSGADCAMPLPSDSETNPQFNLRQDPPELSTGQKLKKFFGPLAVVGLMIVKFGAKLKFLVLPIMKFLPILLKTGGTMVLTIWAYSMFWGWQFALGFVILILIHECGHLVAAKVWKLDVGAPVFIPFMGALIALKEAPRHAWMEFWVAAGGPIAGGLGALACHGIYFATGNPFFAALAYVGYFLNLFNLMPVGFLDGGRMVTALSPWLWLVGIVIAGAWAVYRPSFIIFLIIIMAMPRLFSLFRHRTEKEQRFFEVTRGQRGVAALIYFGLIIALGGGMYASRLPPPQAEVSVEAPEGH